VQGDIFLEAVEGRHVFDFTVFGGILLTMRSASPTINIGVIGYYESIKRYSCFMASAEKSMTQCILCFKKAHERICAAESIGYWPVNADKHKKWACGENFDRLLRSQVLSHEVLAPVPSDMVKKFLCGCKA
jgi:hypothetical protein